MKIDAVRILGVVAVAVAGAVAVVGCDQMAGSEPNKTGGIGERTGAALDRAAEKTVETTTNIARQAVEKTGEALEKAGAAMENTGANMQK